VLKEEVLKEEVLKEEVLKEEVLKEEGLRGPCTRHLFAALSMYNFYTTAVR